MDIPLTTHTGILLMACRMRIRAMGTIREGHTMATLTRRACDWALTIDMATIRVARIRGMLTRRVGATVIGVSASKVRVYRAQSVHPKHSRQLECPCRSAWAFS